MIKIDRSVITFSLEVYHPDTGSAGTLSSEELKGKWVVLVFYPADFTFVCPTELADLNQVYPALTEMGATVVAVSTDTVYTHKAWLEVEQLLKGVAFPMAADHTGTLSKALGIYDEETGMAQRASFIIDPEGIVRALDIVSDPIGRNAEELVRKLKALQYVRSHPGNVCPLRWEDIGTLTPSVSKAGHVAQELKHG